MTGSPWLMHICDTVATLVIPRSSLNPMTVCAGWFDTQCEMQISKSRQGNWLKSDTSAWEKWTFRVLRWSSRDNWTMLPGTVTLIKEISHLRFSNVVKFSGIEKFHHWSSRFPIPKKISCAAQFCKLLPILSLWRMTSARRAECWNRLHFSHAQNSLSAGRGNFFGRVD